MAPEKQKEFVLFMKKDAVRLNKLINSILEISRLEQKRIAHSYKIFAADAVVKKIISNSLNYFNLSENTVEYSGSAFCKCKIDQEAMQIVFNNLIDNAIKYSINPLILKVRFNSTPKKIFINLSDNGIGIDSINFKKIFQKFQRVDDKNIPTVKGTGLGLYWVKNIIRFHSGKISVFSEGYGKGSTFKIELPVYNPSKKNIFNSFTKKEKTNKVLEFVDEKYI